MSHRPPSVLGVIPARGGSKGIPRKNIIPLAGKPLISYTIETAKRSKRLSSFIVSTDDEEIAEVAASAGARVPFLRPPELAHDTTPQIDVIRHALQFAEDECDTSYDAVVILQPPCPLRLAEDIDGSIELLTESHADCVVTFSEVPDPPFYMYEMKDGRPVSLFPEHSDTAYRQTFPIVYRRNGAVYACRRSLIDQGLVYGGEMRAYLMPAERAVNIDAPIDLAWAEFLLLQLRH